MMDDKLFWIKDAVKLLRDNGSKMHAAHVERGLRLIELATKMREAQRAYYKSKKRDALIAAKELEAEFDKETKP
jgi:hypothetical protein